MHIGSICNGLLALGVHVSPSVSSPKFSLLSPSITSEPLPVASSTPLRRGRASVAFVPGRIEPFGLSWGQPSQRLHRASLLTMRAAANDEAESKQPEQHPINAVVNRLKMQVADPKQAFSSADYDAYLDYYDLKSATEGTEKHFDRLEVGGDRIVMQSFMQPEGRATGDLLCVHGYQDHAGVYTEIVRNAVDQGKNVYLFDFQGHGLSTASMGLCSISSFEKYDDALDAVFDNIAKLKNAESAAQSKEITDKVDILAHSTGACVVTNRLLNGGKNRALFMGPLFRNRNHVKGQRAYEVAIKLAKRSGRPIDEVAKSAAHIDVNTSSESYVEFAKKDPLRGRLLTPSWFGALLEWQSAFFKKPTNSDTSLLILQGDGDTVVDGDYNCKVFSEKFERSDVRMLEGVGHQVMYERKEVLEHLHSIVNDYFDGDSR